jgi:Ca-activated chloride channel family protein
MVRAILVVMVLALSFMPAVVVAAPTPQAGPPKITQGCLQAVTPEGKPLGDCPLKHTDVKADISGMVARVTVVQEFENPFKDKIEAVYVFPLGASAAVDDMTMKTGERTIRGIIKRREEARAIYEEAKRTGHVASLLDQERPNIFTQSVANIEPGKGVTVTISYVELLSYEDGLYRFAFPMVVGPRYIPGNATGGEGLGFAPDTDQVPDASKITPPVTPEGTRAGHDISLAVTVNAGREIKELKSRQHQVKSDYIDPQHFSAKVELTNQSEIPNKDFVLEFSTLEEAVSDALLTSLDKRGGFFTLILQPPKKVKPADIVPREIIFVIDTSGSQQGFPIEISKTIMRKAIDGLRPKDTFNLITFSGATRIFWEKPRENTQENRKEALAFLDKLEGGGGTEMMKAINAALGGEHEKDKVRIVAFFTDGYVGNDMEIIDAVQKNALTSRVFSFGIGTSVNRYLLDNMARAGRGEVEYALNKDEGEKAAKKFYERIDAPVLTDISIDYGELAKAFDPKELFPQLAPDLFSVKPLVIFGRYTPGEKPIVGEITIKGKTAVGDYSRKLKVTLPASTGGSTAIASMWARANVENLMNGDLKGAQAGQPDPAVKEKVIGLGLSYNLMTQYTSFVAVEEKIVTDGGQPRTVAVPVEMPEGVSYEGVFGSDLKEQARFGAFAQGGGGRMAMASAMPLAQAASAPPAGSSTYLPAKMESPDKPASAPTGGSLKDRVGAIRDDKQLSGQEKRQKIAELKLAKGLQGLDKKLDKDGNYAKDDVTVKKGRVEIEVYLTDLDEKTLKALADLGFKKLTTSDSLKVALGSIEAAKLEDLAQLDVVKSVKPPIKFD